MVSGMLSVVYDLELVRPSFAFTCVLVAGEAERIRRGADGIEIVLVQSTAEVGKHWPRTKDEYNLVMRGIVYPMTTMLKSVVRVRDVQSRESEGPFYACSKVGIREFVEAYAKGIRPLRPKHELAKKPRSITITLRECGKDNWPQRDSNVREWLQAAHVLTMRHGYHVTFVRDTRLAKVPVSGFEISPGASIDLRTRAELYRSSECNLFVSNGPAWFCLALDAPAIIFRPTCETAGKSARLETMERAGVLRNRQMDGAPVHQWLVWGDDKADLIVQRTLDFMGR